VTAITHR